MQKWHNFLKGNIYKYWIVLNLFLFPVSIHYNTLHNVNTLIKIYCWWFKSRHINRNNANNEFISLCLGKSWKKKYSVVSILWSDSVPRSKLKRRFSLKVNVWTTVILIWLCVELGIFKTALKKSYGITLEVTLKGSRWLKIEKN